MTFPGWRQRFEFPLVLSHHWLGDGIRPLQACAACPQRVSSKQMEEEIQVEPANQGLPGIQPLQWRW